MAISQGQVADLQPGDVVRYTGHPKANGATIEGPVYKAADGSLCVGPNLIIATAAGLPIGDENIVLAFVSRAERPLYVNHPRSGPVGGDVARLDNETSRKVWLYSSTGDRSAWYSANGDRWERPQGVSLRLLVDGETGQVVP